MLNSYGVLLTCKSSIMFIMPHSDCTRKAKVSPDSKAEMSLFPTMINCLEIVHGMGDDERTGVEPY